MTIVLTLVIAWMVTVHTVSRTVQRVAVARAKNSKGAAGTPARTPWSQRGEARKFASEVWRDGFASAHGRYSKAKRKHGEKQTKRQELRDAGIDDRGPLRRVAGDLTAGTRAKLRADWDKAWTKRRKQMREKWPGFPWPEWSGMADDDEEKPHDDGGQEDEQPKGEPESEEPKQDEGSESTDGQTSESPKGTADTSPTEQTDSDTPTSGESEPAATTDTTADPNTASDPSPVTVTDTSTEGDQQTVTATDPGLSEYGTLTGIVTKIDEKRTTLQTNGQRARDLADAARAYEDEAPEIADAADVVDRAMTALDDETDRLRDIVASAQELNAQHGRNLSQSSMDYNRDE